MINFLRILVVSIFLVALSPVSQVNTQSDKLLQDQIEDLWEQLRHPVAFQRAVAAVKLQPYVTETDIKILIYGKLTKYKDGISVTRPDIMALITLLYGGWPDVADKFIDDIYELNDDYYTDLNKHLKEKGENPYTVEDQELYPAIGGFLFKHKKFDKMNEDLPVCKWIQSEFYDDFVNRISKDFIWRDIYAKIAKEDWLYNKFIVDRNVSTIDKFVARMFRGEEIGEKELSSHLLRELYNSYTTDTIPPDTPDMERRYTTDFGLTTFSEIIAIVLNKREWIEEIHKRVEAVTVDEWAPAWDFQKGFWIWEKTEIEIDARNPVLVAMEMARKGETQKVLDYLKPYIMNDNELENQIYDLRSLLHHPWCSEIRNIKGFKELWKDNTTKEFVEPDPNFDKIDWRTP